MATLRERLRDESPHVPLKTAWRAQIRASRAARRTLGNSGFLSNRRAVEQSLDQKVEPEADVAGLKDALRRLLAAEGVQRIEVASEIDERVQAMVASVANEPVQLVVSGWPTWLTVGDQSRILGRPAQSLLEVPPQEAAFLVRELSGLHLGGSTLLLQTGLSTGERLPTVPRGQRSRPRARGTRPWLPFLDEEGRYSLTPELLAKEHAEMLAEHAVVIDAFCGCGGDAIAFAEAGMEVHAVELDPARLELAHQNAEARGVGEQIIFHRGRAQDVVPGLVESHPAAAVYLDPPWGGVDWDREHQVFDRLVPADLMPAIECASQVLLKAPRALDPASLPKLGAPWRIRPAWNPHTCSPAEQVLFLRALARAEGSGGPPAAEQGR